MPSIRISVSLPEKVARELEAFVVPPSRTTQGIMREGRENEHTRTISPTLDS